MQPQICKATSLPLLFVLALSTGCGGYGPVSPPAYEYAKAMYAICNRQAASKLEPIAQQIQASVESNEITPSEANWLLAMVDEARHAEWESAAKKARSMMEDQVRK